MNETIEEVLIPDCHTILASSDASIIVTLNTEQVQMIVDQIIAAIRNELE